MLKFLLSGIWICLVTSASVYAASSWSAGASASAEKGPYIKGLDYQKTRTMTVPVIQKGEVTGYVVARFVFTAEAEMLRSLPVPPEVFVVDEAFRTLYAEDQVDFEHIERYDLTELTQKITERVNARMQTDLIQDTLVDQLNYFPIGVMDRQLNEPQVGMPSQPEATAQKGGGHGGGH